MKTKKIHFKDEFELCYLRHKQLHTIKAWPTAEEMEPFKKIVELIVYKTNRTYTSIFASVGIGNADVKQIANIHLASFLGNFQLKLNPSKMEEFITLFYKINGRNPSPKDIENKNKASLTSYLKQRMEELVRICRQKARNIIGMPSEDFYAYYGPNPPPKKTQVLIKDNISFGFKKLDMPSFKSLRKKLHLKGDDLQFKFAGSWYVAVPLEKRNLTLLDLSSQGYDPYDNMHNKSPEAIMEKQERDDIFSKKVSTFKFASEYRKQHIVRNFIRKNLKNPKYKEEIEIAKEFLKNMQEQDV